MDSSDITGITVEGVGCLILLVLGYKIYKMRIATRSECCGEAVHIETENKGNETPTILKKWLGGEEEEKKHEEPSSSSEDMFHGLTIEDLEKIIETRKRSGSSSNV